jgi:hypothetical protein
MVMYGYIKQMKIQSIDPDWNKKEVQYGLSQLSPGL